MPYPWNIWSKTTESTWMGMDCVALPMPYLDWSKLKPANLRIPILSVLLMFQARGRERSTGGASSRPWGQAAPPTTTRPIYRATAATAVETQPLPSKRLAGSGPESRKRSLSDIRPRTGAAPRGQKNEKECVKTQKMRNPKMRNPNWSHRMHIFEKPPECFFFFFFGLFTGHCPDQSLVWWFLYFLFFENSLSFKHRLYTCNSIRWNVLAFYSFLVKNMPVICYLSVIR